MLCLRGPLALGIVVVPVSLLRAAGDSRHQQHQRHCRATQPGGEWADRVFWRCIHGRLACAVGQAGIGRRRGACGYAAICLLRGPSLVAKTVSQTSTLSSL